MHEELLIDKIQCHLIGVLVPSTKIPLDECPDQELDWLQITVLSWSEENSVTPFLCQVFHLNLHTVDDVGFDHLLLHLHCRHPWSEVDRLGGKIVEALLLLHLVPIWNILSIDTMVGCIVQH
jgi:hypothetical protein